MGKLNRINEFTTPYSFREALRRGGLETKLSMILAGLGNIVHKQVGKGLLFLAAEAAYVVFMMTTGFRCIAMMGSLGTVGQQEIWDDVNQVYR